MVVHLNEHQPERELALAEVKDQIVALLKRQQASAQVMAQATEIMEKAKSQGAGTTEGAYSWEQFTDIGRGDVSVPSEVATELFKMARPAAEGKSFKVVKLADGSAAVVALAAVKAVEQELDDTQRKGVSDFLAGRRGQTDYRDQVESLKAAAEIDLL